MSYINKKETKYLVNTTEKVLILFLISAVVISVLFYMRNQQSISLGIKNEGLGLVMVVICYFLSLIPFTFIYKQYSWIVIIFFYLYIWINLVNMLTLKGSFYSHLYHLALYSLPIIVLTLCYSYSRKYGLDKQLLNYIFFSYIVLIIQFFIIRLETGGGSALYELDDSRLLIAYYPLFLMPLILVHPNKYVRFLGWCIMLFVIFSSGKRGGLVAIVLSSVVYVLVNQYINSKSLSRWFISILGFIMLLVLIFVFSDISNNNLIIRISSVSEDGGSGRDLVWAETLFLIQKQSFVQKVMGSGINGVILNSPLDLSAHNDFLEMRYDYGIIGLSLYVVVFIMLIIKSISITRTKIKYSSSMMCLLMLFFVLSMISHVIYYYFMVVFSISLGFLLGGADYEQFKQNAYVKK